MRKVIFISLIIGILLVSESFAAFPPMILNARAGALGEAYVALSNDLGGLYYNPAGLSYINKLTLGFNHLQLPESFTTVEFLGGAINLGDISVGAALQTKGVTNQEELLFPFSENALQISIAKKIMPNLSLGTTGYLYMTTLDTGSATGFGIDIGAIYEINSNIKLGAVWYNPVSYLKWSTGTVDSIERSDFVIGTCFNLKLSNVLLNLLIDFSLYDKMYFYQRIHTGLEAKITNTPISLRMGYNGEKNSLSLGMGINIEKFQIDYAFLYSKDMSNQHILSLSTNF